MRGYPKRAISGLMHRRKSIPYSITSSSRPSSVAGYRSRVPWRCSDRRRSLHQQRREPRAMRDASIGRRKSSTQEARGHNWASHHVLPAVHGKRRSRDETGIVGGEENHAARDLLRLAKPIDRKLRQDGLVENVI